MLHLSHSFCTLSRIVVCAGKAAAFYKRFGGALDSDASQAVSGAADGSYGGDQHVNQILSNEEYERELEALRKISDDATREVATRQANRDADSRYGAAAQQGHVTNPMHASPYTGAGLDSPWLGSSHGAADE